jgi:predicted PurR-regulated permease PerM
LNEHPQLLEWVNENVDLQSLNYASLIQKALDVVSDGVSIILSGAVTAIGDIAGTLMNAVIGIVFSVYCLFNKEDLARQGRKILYAYLPEKWSDNTIRVLRMTNTTFSNFLSGQCLEVCILGCMFAVSMAIFNMPYIPLVSVLVAVTAFIPVVGAFIGCIVGAFFILVNNPVQALWFVVMFLVIQQVEGNLIYPRVVGTSIGLPGMWVLLAVAIGGELMGVAGMFLMIPLSSVIYALFREITKKKLDDNNIDESKLQVQPPELRSRLKKHVERFKKKKADKKPDKKAEKK